MRKDDIQEELMGTTELIELLYYKSRNQYVCGGGVVLSVKALNTIIDLLEKSHPKKAIEAGEKILGKKL